MHNSRFYNFILTLRLKNILNYISFLLLFSSLIIFLTTFISFFFKERGEFSLVFKIIGLTHAQSLKLSFLLILTNFILKNVDNLLWNPLDIAINRNFNSRIFYIFNFVLFVLISIYFFSTFTEDLFFGVDGDYMLSLEKSQAKWNNSTTFFSANFLQGLGGNIIFPLNTNVDLGYLSSRIFGDNFNKTISHTIWASLLFVSSLIFFRVIQLPSLLSLSSAWLVPILILFPQPFRFYSVAALIPHLATSISLSLIFSSILLINKKNHVDSFISTNSGPDSLC